jgi:hypothetical protein
MIRYLIISWIAGYQNPLRFIFLSLIILTYLFILPWGMRPVLASELEVSSQFEAYDRPPDSGRGARGAGGGR